MPNVSITSRRSELAGRSTDTAPYSRRLSFIRDLLVVVILMVALAGLLYLLSGNFPAQLRYSLAIGISTLSATHAIMALRGIRRPDWKAIGGAIITGMLPGILIGTYLNGWDPSVMHAQYRNQTDHTVC